MATELSNKAAAIVLLDVVSIEVVCVWITSVDLVFKNPHMLLAVLLAVLLNPFLDIQNECVGNIVIIL